MSDKKHTLLRMGNYLWQEKWLILLALVLTLGSNGLALLGPYLSGEASNDLRTECVDDRRIPKSHLSDASGYVPQTGVAAGKVL